MENVSVEMKTIRKSKRKVSNKTPLTEMKNVFYGLISRLNTAEERINEFEDR